MRTPDEFEVRPVLRSSKHPNRPGPRYLVERGLRLEIPLRLVPPVRARFSIRRNPPDKRWPW
jgi:hypothetical protein